MKRKDKPRPIEDLIEAILNRYNLNTLAKEQRVFKVWREALGEALASHARPTAIHGGRLVALVKDSAWLQELQFIKGDIIKKLNRALGGRVIKDIRFKVGTWGTELDDEGADDGLDEVTLPPELIDEAKAAVEVIKDPKLRERALNALLANARKTIREGGES